MERRLEEENAKYIEQAALISSLQEQLNQNLELEKKEKSEQEKEQEAAAAKKRNQDAIVDNKMAIAWASG